VKRNRTLGVLETAAINLCNPATGRDRAMKPVISVVAEGANVIGCSQLFYRKPK